MMIKSTALALSLALLSSCSLYTSSDRDQFNSDPRKDLEASLAPLVSTCSSTNADDAEALSAFDLTQNKLDLFIDEDETELLVVRAAKVLVTSDQILVCQFDFDRIVTNQQALSVSRELMIAPLL